MKLKVSVIVPVYNTGELLKACLDSLVAQTLHEAEFILIDDGSTDGSGDVCDAYAEKDSRFRVIHKANAGVSRARNAGIQTAVGEFIGFVDSDDTVSPDMFQTLYDLAQIQNADIVICDSIAVGAGKSGELETIQTLPKSCLLTKDCITPDILLEIAGSAGRCVYRREMLYNSKIEFPEDLKFSEDRIFNIRAMGAAKQIFYTKEAYYIRLLHAASAVHKFYPDYFQIMKDAANRTQLALAESWNNDETLQTAYLSQFIGGSIAAINNYFYKTATISHREAIRKVRELCEDLQLRTALERTGFGGIRGKWILKKRILLLSACAMYLNWKYGR